MNANLARRLRDRPAPGEVVEPQMGVGALTLTDQMRRAE